MALPREHIHHIHRIVLFTLDGLYSGVGLHALVSTFPERFALICVSKRYGGKYGSFLKQVVTNFQRGGFSFVNYLSFHFIYFYPLLFATDIINRLFKKPKKVYSVMQLARKFRIPLVYTENPNQGEMIERIRLCDPDLIISAYFDHVIRQTLINLPRMGVINVHTSLLPDFRGPFPSLWPLIYNQQEIGVSVHYINSEELDTGPIIAQKRLPRIVGESVIGTDCRLFREGIELVKRAILDIEEGTARAVVQEARGRYFSFPRRNDLVKLRRHGLRLISGKDVIRQFLEI